MLENLRAKKVRNQEISADNIFVLEKNSPKLINESNNPHIACINEEQTDEISKEKYNETLYIHSNFDDSSCAMIGNEFCLNFLSSPPKVDFNYYYFSEEKKVKIYLYDMKKTFSGIDTILHLINQWQSSIRTAKYCIDELENYEISEINIGVITENDDIERRTKEINSIMNEPETSEKIPSFIKSKHNANISGDIAKRKVLKGILDGKINISGSSYQYDIFIFDDNKKYHMYFNNGILEK